ncbi:MAG: DUF5021 domain-containing protein [Oscillospiraceae bacterium]|nr:DUF5021 domain-containing protein [Oscillospiraceae bacterium]
MIKKLQALRAKKGFTLVELIVVIAIIGVLAAILVPTMMGFVTSSRVTSANSTAASFEDQIENFLTEADTKGYGMKLSNTSVSKIIISKTSDGWNVQVDTPGSFKAVSGGASWSTSAASINSSATKASNSTNACTLLAISLRDLFPDMNQCYVEAYVQAGNVVGLFYTADASSAGNLSDLQANFVSATGALAATTTVDWANKICKWDGNTAGINVDGLIVGTSPALDLGSPSVAGT